MNIRKLIADALQAKIDITKRNASGHHSDSLEGEASLLLAAATVRGIKTAMGEVERVLDGIPRQDVLEYAYTIELRPGAAIPEIRAARPGAVSREYGTDGQVVPNNKCLVCLINVGPGTNHCGKCTNDMASKSTVGCIALIVTALKARPDKDVLSYGDICALVEMDIAIVKKAASTLHQEGGILLTNNGVARATIPNLGALHPELQAFLKPFVDSAYSVAKGHINIKRELSMRLVACLTGAPINAQREMFGQTIHRRLSPDGDEKALVYEMNGTWYTPARLAEVMYEHIAKVARIERRTWGEFVVGAINDSDELVKRG